MVSSRCKLVRRRGMSGVGWSECGSSAGVLGDRMLPRLPADGPGKDSGAVSFFPLLTGKSTWEKVRPAGHICGCVPRQSRSWLPKPLGVNRPTSKVGRQNRSTANELRSTTLSAKPSNSFVENGLVRTGLGPGKLAASILRRLLLTRILTMAAMCIRMPLEMRQAVADLAKRRDYSMEGFVRNLLQRELDREPMRDVHDVQVVLSGGYLRERETVQL